jgi:hypothetical protein
MNYDNGVYHKDVTLNQFSNVKNCTIHGAVHSNLSANYDGCTIHGAIHASGRTQYTNCTFLDDSRLADENKRLIDHNAALVVEMMAMRAAIKQTAANLLFLLEE